MNFKNQLKGLTSLLMVLGCMFFFNSCEDPIEDPCLLRDCGNGTCVENENSLDGYFCNCDDGFVNATDGRCTDCADGFYGENCDSTSPCDDVTISCPTGASCVSDTTDNTTFCVCDVTDAVLSADSTACVCPEGLILNADSTACVEDDARLKFIGIYTQNDVDCTTGAVIQPYTVVVSLDPNNDNQIILGGFGGFDNGEGHDVEAGVTGNNFSIVDKEYTNAFGTVASFALADPSSVGSYQVLEDGKKKLVVVYTLTSNGTDTCTAELIEQ